MGKFVNALIFLLFLNVVQAQELKLGLPLGHTSSVDNAVYSPNGKYILTASYDGTAIVWEASSGKLLHSFVGIMDWNPSIQFSPDSRHILLVHADSTAKIWKVSNGELLYSLKGHTSWVLSAEFSPNGRYFVTASSDSTAKIWDASSGEILKNLVGHSGSVRSAKFSFDSRYVVTASKDSTVRIWNAIKGRHVYNLIQHEGAVWLAKFSPDGRYIVTISRDKTAKVWEVSTGKLIKSIEGITNSVISADFSPDGRYIATSSFKDLIAKVWEMESGNLYMNLQEHDKYIRSVTFSPNGQYVLTASMDRTAKLWDLESKKLVHSLEGHTSRLYAAKFSPNGKHIITNSFDNSSKVWETKSGKLLYSLERRTHPILSATFSPDGQYILAAYDGESPKLWEKKSGKLAHNLEGHLDQVNSVKYSLDGRYIVTASKDKTAKVWEVSTGKLIKTIEGHTDHVNSAAFSPDGHYIVTGSSDRTARVWELSTGKLIHNFEWHFDKVLSAEFSSDGQYVVTGSFRRTARIWEIASGKLLYMWENASFKPPKLSSNNKILLSGSKVWEISEGNEPFNLVGGNENDWIFYSTFSPDDNLILTTTRDGTVRLWETSSGKLIYTLKGHTTYVTSGSFQLEGRYVTTVSMDNTAKIWESTSGKLLQSLEGHTDDVTSAEFSPDGKIILTASKDGSMILWDPQTGKMLARQFNFGENRTVTITDDGLFDATPEAMKLMYWTQGNEIIEFEQLKDRFYEPGLWKKVLGYSKEPLRKTRGLGAIDLYPEMAITHPNNNDGIMKIRLTNRGGGIGKVQIWINNKEVTTDARKSKTNPNSKTVAINYQISGHPYLKAGEINKIEVKAYNEEGYLSSRLKKIYYESEGLKEDYDPSLYAIIIGTSNYSGENLDLRYASKDAKDIAQTMKLVGEEYFTNGKVNIQLLTTDSENFIDWPTKANIENAFKNISTTAKPYDVLMVYMAGHGMNYGGTEGDFYYLSSDASSGNLKDPAVRNNVAISSAELTEYVKMVPALKQVLIIDACHSGQLAEDLMASRGERSSSEIRALERLKDRTGTYVLAGSAADAVSYEATIYGQGLLTYSLLFGMKGAALRDGKFVDVMKLFQFCADNVPELAENIGGIQKPEVRVPFGGQSFDIGLSTEVTQQNIKLPSPKPMFVRSAFQNENTFNDDLRLSEQIDDQLKGLSNGNSENRSLVFIDASRFVEAYSLKGRYLKVHTGYEFDLRVFKGEELVSKFQLSGNQDELAAKIIDKISALLSANKIVAH